MRKTLLAGALAAGALILAGAVVVGLTRSGDTSTPTDPSTRRETAQVNNTFHPADQHDDDRDPEDPIIDSGKPSTWEQFAEDSQAGVPSDSQPQDGPPAVSGTDLRATGDE
ncbi:hypothetical protein [Nocardia farcinica]|uniref:hypothetical protein n=1 Tax=Nocardia farcinica TaxID=37329 RepID=UPI0037A517AD